MAQVRALYFLWRLQPASQGKADKMRFLIRMRCCLSLTVSQTGDHDLMHSAALRHLRKGIKSLNVSPKVDLGVPGVQRVVVIESGDYFQDVIIFSCMFLIY